MTNDTNTLNGALRELGETMADNLTTMGVPSTYDEGLTTLAGKILEIAPSPTPSFDGISLTGDKSILSAADSEYVTLTAQLLDGQSSAAVEGETVSFKVYKSKDDSLVTTLTDDTNSSGVATVSYYGQGTGDLYIKAECTFVSETYIVQDCIIYDPLTSNSGKWTIPSGVSSTYSSDGWRISANDYKQIKLTDKLTSACSVEFIISDYNASYSGRGSSVLIYQYTNGETAPNQQIMIQSSDTTIDVLGTTINHTFVKGAVYRIEYTPSTMSVYENDVLLASANNNIGFPTRFEVHMGGNGRYAIYKDLKIKPL